ncbi:hypothetical protein [Thiococcus pfennigii]|uniref:hypothetical protein n=1 Tax=Thiococcus pfennigii TaxID=1057 RepID=UPI0019059110|nr:hypothetical protein [Thiococcus pfennigii]MBK1701221.1 hypothetical protein [Thiococcus pfennigii]
MDTDYVGTCWHCGRRLAAVDYGRETRCLDCDRDTRVCRNCRHYAPGRANECLEPMVERVLAKDRANFCEWFEPADRVPQGGTSSPGEDLRAAAEALFRR